MRGRKPKPTHLKLLAGNPGHRAVNKDEPEFDLVTELPEPPDYISGEARIEWMRALPMLMRANMITDIDLTAFAAYCQAFGHWVDAEEHVRKSGIVMVRPGPNNTNIPFQNPYLSIAHKSMEQMRAFLVEFGMTPSSRSRVKAAPRKETANPYAEFKRA